MQKLLMKLATLKNNLPLLHSTDVSNLLQLNQESKKKTTYEVLSIVV